MRRWLSVASLLLSALILALVGTVWVYASAHRGVRRVPGLGNYAETVEMLPPPAAGAFRFAVMGDPEGGLHVYRQLMCNAAAAGAGFAIITGDVAAHPTEEAFGLFEYEYSHLGPAALPTFAAIGNHDMPRGGEASLFRSHLGPEFFSFIHGRSLFLFIDNNKSSSYAECERFVREQIAIHGAEADHVFIAMHYPIVDYRKGGMLFHFESSSSYMRSILDSEHVTALLMGHVHGYLRDTYKDTLLLVTGGAGGHLYDRSQFFHMVLIDVTPEGIHDQVVRIEEPSKFMDRLRSRIVLDLYPALIGQWHRPVVLLIVAGASLACGLLTRRSRVRRRMPLTESVASE